MEQVLSVLQTALPVFSNDPAEKGTLSSALSALTCITIILFAVLSVIL